MTTRDELAEVIRSVTDLWDEPLDEVHDVPQIVNALLARFPLLGETEVEFGDEWIDVNGRVRVEVVSRHVTPWQPVGGESDE